MVPNGPVDFSVSPRYRFSSGIVAINQNKNVFMSAVDESRGRNTREKHSHGNAVPETYTHTKNVVWWWFGHRRVCVWCYVVASLHRRPSKVGYIPDGILSNTCQYFVFIHVCTVHALCIIYASCIIPVGFRQSVNEINFCIIALCVYFLDILYNVWSNLTKVLVWFSTSFTIEITLFLQRRSVLVFNKNTLKKWNINQTGAEWFADNAVTEIINLDVIDQSYRTRRRHRLRSVNRQNRLHLFRRYLRVSTSSSDKVSATSDRPS